jgi:hypothetical protein
MLPSCDLFTVDCFPLECLSDASFLGKLLVLSANVRLTGKFLPGANTLAYLASTLATKRKSFMTLTPGRRRGSLSSRTSTSGTAITFRSPFETSRSTRRRGKRWESLEEQDPEKAPFFTSCSGTRRGIAIRWAS